MRHYNSPTTSIKRKTQLLLSTNDFHNNNNNTNTLRSSPNGTTTSGISSSSLSISQQYKINSIVKIIMKLCISIAFVIGTVIIPYQQRKLFVSFTIQQQNDNNNNNKNKHTNNNIGIHTDDRIEDSIKLSSTTTTMTANRYLGNTGSASINTNKNAIAMIIDKSSDITTQQQLLNQKEENVGISLVSDVDASQQQQQQRNIFQGIIARPFQPWPDGTYLPCYEPPKDWSSMTVQFSPAKRGFFYVKPYKTGSSTTSGVHLRIARNVANRRRTAKFNVTICDARFDHGPDYFPGHTLYRNRIKDESFLWTIIRDPTKRAISQFFHFEVSRQKKEPTDTAFKQFLRDKHPMQDYYFRALYTKEKFTSRSEIHPVKAGNHILSSYDFIGITERLDESFVALMMILRLRIADILYLSAKTKGGYDDAGGSVQNKCTYIWPSFLSSGMEEFMRSKEWYDMVRYDNLLYAAVNRSLDMTIDALGRDLFYSKLQQFQEAQKIANERCLPTTVFPCDTGGTFHDEQSTDCIWKDSGCGVTCLDSIATELNLW